jgi:hypothetical protein
MTLPDNLSRRAMLVKLGILFNGIVAAILAIPILRYVLSPVTRSRKVGYETWLPLGSVDQFPAGQTRLGTFRNPDVQPWDGKTADSACWVRRIDDHTFRSLPSIACISAVPFVGFPNPASSCVRATAASITKMALAPPVLPSAASSNTHIRLRKGSSSSKPVNCPLPSVRAVPARSWI